MTDKTPTRVLIVDDHPMVADGICALLETFEDIEVVGTLTNGVEAVEHAQSLSPDVILLDLNMPQMGGLTATEILLEQRPETRVLILTMHDSPEYISAALNHGAVGYVLKDVPTEHLKDAIDTVMAGKTYLCNGARRAIEPKTQDGREPLTEREQTVLLELAQGKSNKDVACALDISVRTVETHRKNIKRKLGISSTAGLTRYAMEHGVLQGSGRF
jgi:DNA-binding NarL/FixJ family response regulator